MNEDISILVVEDEALIGQHLSLSLQDEGYRVIGVAGSFDEAIEMVEQERPDFALLDINLDGLLDGIDLAGELRRRFQLPFIFITSNTDSRTIARAKVTQPAGFIVKPFQTGDLRPSIEIALYNAKQPQAATKGMENESFFIKDKNEMKRVYYAEIDFAEAADNYTILHTPQKKYMLSQTLKVIEQKLSPFGFLRIHRSYLVNVSKIDCVRPTEVIVGEKALSTSANARGELMKFIRTL